MEKARIQAGLPRHKKQPQAVLGFQKKTQYTFGMYEIELKAHIKDRDDLTKRLHSFASFKGSTHKFDTYWRSATDNIQIRVRQERKQANPHGNMEETTTTVTYKRKQLRVSQDGTSIEVNDEQEFSISSRNPFEEFLQDAGFSILRKKEKHVEQWQFEDALLELCNVPPLGDFLEMEILAADNKEATVQAARTKLSFLLEKCGIPESDIEPRYYNEMLSEHDKL